MNNSISQAVLEVNGLSKRFSEGGLNVSVLQDVNLKVAAGETVEGRIVTVRKDRFRYPDGEVVDREVITHPGAVAVLALGFLRRRAPGCSPVRTGARRP